MDNKYKPFSLTLVNQFDEKPSSLKKPFKFVVEYIHDDTPAVTQYIETTSFISSVVSVPKLVFNQKIQTSGFDSSGYGSPTVVNKNKEIKTTGFNSLSFSLPKVFNSRQYINNNNRGFLSQAFGTPFLMGGVKYVTPSGISSQQTGTPNVINTRADQYIQGQGIAPPSFPSPTVSPRFLAPTGIKSDNFGQPFIQRSPSPIGFETSLYGVAWVSHSPRHLLPAVVDGFNAGYPTIYDPTQRILLDSKGIEGGIFGDTALRNTRRILTVNGIDAAQLSDWATVESNLRSITSKGFDSQSIGESTIQNKSPSLHPSGFDSLNGLSADIGYRHRELKPTGFYQPKFGSSKLEKPPELRPAGFNSNSFGNAFISNFTRTITSKGVDSQIFGEHDTWFRYRTLSPTGIDASAFGVQRIEHGRRNILALGADHSAFSYGAWFSYGIRELQAISIEAPLIPRHQVGGARQIMPFGFVATLFGERITPVSQSLYPQGFSNAFGLSSIDLGTKYIEPKGFFTYDSDQSQRFGTAKFWNLRQDIIQTFDADSGLTPPRFDGWTSIENRNKVIGAIGADQSRLGNGIIENNARLIQPIGINALNFDRPLIADRVRSLKLDGIEPLYISGWTVVYNDARVISPSGFNSQIIESSSVENTRRYYPRVGNFESLEMGLPMISDRIRTLSIESRHSIEPPPIPLHKIDLYTRYIDEVGRNDDYMAFGNPSLTIHWNIISPRWTLRDAYGFPTVSNLTPEIPVFGHNSEEFGNTFVRTQWRSLQQIGANNQLFGQSEIDYRNKKIGVISFNQSAFGKSKVTKTGIPPYYPQHIWLNAVDLDGAQMEGHGIPAPKDQVLRPFVRSNVISPNGFNASSIGQAKAQSNGILVEPGIQELTVGSHSIGLKNRVLKAPSINDSMVVSKPRLSPHTIYAVMDSPTQARQNHEPANLHYVNSDSGARPPGEVFGFATISLQHRRITAGIGAVSGMGSGHKLSLKKQYISIDKGITSLRMGVNIVGPFNQVLEQFDSNDMTTFGDSAIKLDDKGPRLLKPKGIDALEVPKNTIEHRNRTLNISGFDALLMGQPKYNDTPFMWQGLRIGELISANYGGLDSQVFGQSWVSLKVRDLRVDGFDSFACEYDYTAFDKRMRVTKTPLPKPSQSIQPVGFDAFSQGVPNIKPAVHYIRPDGNADQFRKGGF
ncbi:hypothetical protein [Acinetobacter sp. TR11]|uniref:hypothetical protein n=1 Tax=Acinetobacter sp. TR11 TaxID=3003393 RepID=UPI0022ABECBF|nr:hypothetical protein [Acinetobacter sp. TR11]WAU72384.1 hypothetical protein O1450_09650 [Acinetobacter sp. TR11]